MEKSEKSDHERALNLIEEGKIAVIKTKEDEGYFHVTGTTDEYLVLMPNFCTCDQFNLRSIKIPGNVCYHILAIQMAGKITRSSDMDWTKLLLKNH